MKKLFLLLLLIPSLVFAQSTTYLQDETIGASGNYGEMNACYNGTRSRLVTCDSTGALYVTPGKLAPFYGDMVTLAFGAIPAVFTVEWVSGGLEWKQIDVVNASDCLLELSFDAGVTSHYAVPGYSTKEFAYSQYGMVEDSDIWLKSTAGALCTQGAVYISGIR